MYVLKDSKTINEEKIIREIQDIAIKDLKNRFGKLNISTIEINHLKKDIVHISRDVNQRRKINKLKLFLLNYCANYIQGDNSPLNLFSKECGIIFKNHFLQ